MNQLTKALFVIGAAGFIGTTLVFGMGSALLPLLIAFGLAYLNFPLIRGLEKSGVPRHYAVLGVFILIAVVLASVVVLVVPGLLSEGLDFLRELPQTSAVAAEKLETLAGSFGYTFDLSEQRIKEYLVDHASAVSADFLKSTSNFLKGVFSNFIHGILFILNLLLIPLFFFHLVNGYESISSEAKDLIPIPWRPRVFDYAQQMNTVLSGYIRGQMLVALILAALYGAGFSIIGLRFGLLIGIGTGLFSFIPYFGSIMGFIAAITVALANFSGFGTIAAVVAVFVVVQALEGTIITPKLVGNRVGLGVLATILAIIIGGNLLGFVGMIVAIPIAAVLKTILRDLKQEYQSLDIYRGTHT